MVNLTSGSVSARGNLIGGDALPLLILHHHRQAPAVRGARFTVPHRHNDAPAIGAAGIYRRRQAEGLGVSLPVQRLDAMQTMDLQLQLHRLPDCRFQGGAAR